MSSPVASAGPKSPFGASNGPRAASAAALDAAGPLTGPPRLGHAAALRSCARRAYRRSPVERRVDHRGARDQHGAPECHRVTERPRRHLDHDPAKRREHAVVRSLSSAVASCPRRGPPARPPRRPRVNCRFNPASASSLARRIWPWMPRRGRIKREKARPRGEEQHCPADGGLRCAEARAGRSRSARPAPARPSARCFRTAAGRSCRTH